MQNITGSWIRAEICQAVRPMPECWAADDTWYIWSCADSGRTFVSWL